MVIYPPHYEESKEKLRYLDGLFDDYLKRKKLLRLPNPVKVFFKYQDDHEIERLSEQLEEVVQDLANTRSSRIIAYLNQLPRLRLANDIKKLIVTNKLIVDEIDNIQQK